MLFYLHFAEKYLPLLIKSRSFLLVYSQMLGEKMAATGKP
jgi:hypothetical protein